MTRPFALPVLLFLFLPFLFASPVPPSEQIPQPNTKQVSAEIPGGPSTNKPPRSHRAKGGVKYVNPEDIREMIDPQTGGISYARLSDKRIRDQVEAWTKKLGLSGVPSQATSPTSRDSSSSSSSSPSPGSPSPITKGNKHPRTHDRPAPEESGEPEMPHAPTNMNSRATSRLLDQDASNGLQTHLTGSGYAVFKVPSIEDHGKTPPSVNPLKSGVSIKDQPKTGVALSNAGSETVVTKGVPAGLTVVEKLATPLPNQQLVSSVPVIQSADSGSLLEPSPKRHKSAKAPAQVVDNGNLADATVGVLGSGRKVDPFALEQDMTGSVIEQKNPAYAKTWPAVIPTRESTQPSRFTRIAGEQRLGVTSPMKQQTSRPNSPIVYPRPPESRPAFPDALDFHAKQSVKSRVMDDAVFSKLVDDFLSGRALPSLQ